MEFADWGFFLLNFSIPPPPFPLPLSRSSPALALAVQLPPELVSGAMMSRSRTPPRRDCYARMLMRARTASDLARIAAHSLFRHELKKRDCEAAALWLSSRGVRAWSQLWQLTPSSVSSLGVSRDAQATVLRAIQLAIECRLDETLGTSSRTEEHVPSSPSCESDTIDYRETTVRTPPGAHGDNDPIVTTSP